MQNAQKAITFVANQNFQPTPAYPTTELTVHVVVTIAAPHQTDTQTLEARLAGAVVSELGREALPVSGCYALVRPAVGRAA